MLFTRSKHYNGTKWRWEKKPSFADTHSIYYNLHKTSMGWSLRYCVIFVYSRLSQLVHTNVNKKSPIVGRQCRFPIFSTKKTRIGLIRPVPPHS